jgi:hypothetical protein
MADEAPQSATATNGVTPPPTAAPTGGSEWTSSLPPDVRGHASLSDVKDVGDLATRYVKLNKPFAEQLPEKIRGEAAFKDIKNPWPADPTQRPEDDQDSRTSPGLPRATPRLKPVYDKLGRPAKPGDYKLTVPEGFPPAEKAYAESVMAAAHGAGLSQKQFETMTGWLYERAGQSLAQQKANQDSQLANWLGSLKTEWGAAFDTKVEQSRSALMYYAEKAGVADELKKAMDETGAGNHPAVVKLFNYMGVNLHEDGKLTGKAFGEAALKSPVEAQQQINALRQDANFMKAYMNQNKRDPAHVEAVDSMKALHELAYPSGQAA